MNRTARTQLASDDDDADADESSVQRTVPAADAVEQRRMQQQTANMTASLAGELGHAALMFLEIDKVVATMLRAESTPGVFVLDPHQAMTQ
jgi:hypothetical protein